MLHRLHTTNVLVTLTGKRFEKPGSALENARKRLKKFCWILCGMWAKNKQSVQMLKKSLFSSGKHDHVLSDLVLRDVFDTFVFQLTLTIFVFNFKFTILPVNWTKALQNTVSTFVSPLEWCFNFKSVFADLSAHLHSPPCVSCLAIWWVPSSGSPKSFAGPVRVRLNRLKAWSADLSMYNIIYYL